MLSVNEIVTVFLYYYACESMLQKIILKLATSFMTGYMMLYYRVPVPVRLVALLKYRCCHSVMMPVLTPQGIPVIGLPGFMASVTHSSTSVWTNIPSKQEDRLITTFIVYIYLLYTHVIL